MNDFLKQYDKYRSVFQEALKSYCKDMHYYPSILTESMQYSLLSGGKRVRPVLFFSTLEILGKPYLEELGFALALECIHTYSLIHDDLPAMDNDDFRRGNPSNHKVYGEANAILAGDALLSLAFSILLKESEKDKEHLYAAQYLSDSAGAGGMIAGQSADLLFEGKSVGEEQLNFIYEHKTAKLIQAPLVMAAILANRCQTEMASFGKNLGFLFQLTDDILDQKGDRKKMGKTLGKDDVEDKPTCIKLYGMEQSELLADRYAGKCLETLVNVPNAKFLREFVSFVRDRDF